MLIEDDHSDQYIAITIHRMDLGSFVALPNEALLGHIEIEISYAR